MLTLLSTIRYIMDSYGPLYGASANSVNSLARYTLAAAFPLFIVQTYRGLGIGWATSLLGLISLVMMPIPWVFYKLGPKLREKSRYVKSG